MLRAIGVKPTVNLIDYTTEYLPKYLANAGKFDGLLYRSGVASANDAVVWLDWRYKTQGGDGWIGFDAAGKGDGSGDPQVDALLSKARQKSTSTTQGAGQLRPALPCQDGLRSQPSRHGRHVRPGLGLHCRTTAPSTATAARAVSWWLDETLSPSRSPRGRYSTEGAGEIRPLLS